MLENEFPTNEDRPLTEDEKRYMEGLKHVCKGIEAAVKSLVSKNGGTLPAGHPCEPYAGIGWRDLGATLINECAPIPGTQDFKTIQSVYEYACAVFDSITESNPAADVYEPTEDDFITQDDCENATGKYTLATGVRHDIGYFRIQDILDPAKTITIKIDQEQIRAFKMSLNVLSWMLCGCDKCNRRLAATRIEEQGGPDAEAIH